MMGIAVVIFLFTLALVIFKPKGLRIGTSAVIGAALAYVFVFKKEDGVTLKAAWEMYKTYCDEAKVGFPYSQRIFKEELKT